MTAKFFLPSILLLATLFLINSPSIVQAEDEGRDASQLIPEDTVVFVQTKDIRELRESFMKTQSGKFFQDEELAPMLGDLYRHANEAYDENLKDRLGVELADLPNLVQGEVTFALSAPPKSPLVAILFVEIGEENEVAETLLEKGREIAKEEGNEETVEEFGTTEIRAAGDVCYVQRDGKLCFCAGDDRGANREMIESILNHWDGNVDKRARTFSDNRKFVNVMARCRGTKDEPPHIRFFVDPIELYRKATRGNAVATVALGIIRNLGLDGLSAIGGSTINATEDFDSMIHLHVLLANPRAGVIEMLAMKSGDLTPESWVPYDISSYASANWDFEKTYVELGAVYDKFYEEGSFEEAVEENVNENIGVKLKEDVIELLDGRVTFATMYVKPTINGVANMFSMGLKDPEKMQETLEAIMEKTNVSESLEEKKMAGYKYYRGPSPDFEGRRERRYQRRVERAKEEGREPPERRVDLEFRAPEPCFGIIDNYLIFSDSEDFFRKAIETIEEQDEQLANDPDFIKTQKQIRKHLHGKKAGMITYNRPEEGLRLMHDMVNSKNVRDVLKEGSENSEFARRMREVLTDNELPEFEHFLQYIAPVGGVMVNDESGFHYMGFALKPQD